MEREYLTKEKYEELSRELNELKFNKRKEVAKRLEYARSLGDLAENAEYHSAREEQADVEERIIQLENLLKTSEIIGKPKSQAVAVGSTVVVERPGGEKNEFVIVGSAEADALQGKISYHSPLGASLLGKKKGETAEVLTPKGEVVSYKIVAIK